MDFFQSAISRRQNKPVASAQACQSSSILSKFRLRTSTAAVKLNVISSQKRANEQAFGILPVFDAVDLGEGAMHSGHHRRQEGAARLCRRRACCRTSGWPRWSWPTGREHLCRAGRGGQSDDPAGIRFTRGNPAALRPAFEEPRDADPPQSSLGKDLSTATSRRPRLPVAHARLAYRHGPDAGIMALGQMPCRTMCPRYAASDFTPLPTFGNSS